MLKAHGGGESRAAAVFDGAAGRYAVTVGYIDETDGAARMAIRINGVDVDAWTWDGAFGDAVVTRRGHAERAIFGVALKGGDVVELVGQRDGGEPLRTDWLETGTSVSSLRASARGDETLVELAGFALEPSAASEAFAQAAVGYLDDSHSDSRLDHQDGQGWGDWL